MKPSDECCTFPLLAEPATYVRCQWNLYADDAKMNYWLELFRDHFPKLAKAAIASCEASMGRQKAQQAAQHAQEHFFGWLHNIESTPRPDPSVVRLDILDICIAREAALRAAEIPDAYLLEKQRENEAALQLLPELLEELDALPALERDRAVIEGVFAGNIFDLGATDTIRLFEESGGVNFHHARNTLKVRPWLIDDLDRWLAKMRSDESYRCALLFVDNAGTDIVLGMLPFARYLIKCGTRVILTANSLPSLNDITHDELSILLRKISEFDSTIAAAVENEQLLQVPSGNGLPLIDLQCISKELAHVCESHPIDLVMLEGMGRAIESNLHARLTCDTLKIAMIKDQGVADALGGELYDLAIRFDQV